MKKFLAFVLMMVLSQPYIAFAAPLTGANADVGKYYFCTGGDTCNDDTTDVNSRGTISWVFLGQDHAYIGDSSLKFNKIVVDIQTASGISSFVELSPEYFNGTSWQTLVTLPAEENFFQFTGVQTFSFTPPVDWAAGTPEEDGGATSAYYIRFADGTQGAEINQISLYTIGGAGQSVPEMGDIMMILPLGVAGIYMYSKKQATQQSGV